MVGLCLVRGQLVLEEGELPSAERSSSLEKGAKLQLLLGGEKLSLQ